MFVVAYAAAIPFMNTSLIQGPIAMAWHGADIAYFVNLLVAAALYGGYRLVRTRERRRLTVVSMKSSIRSTTSLGRSTCGKWPTPASTSSRLPGRASCAA